MTEPHAMTDEEPDDDRAAPSPRTSARAARQRVVVYGVLPALAVLTGATAGFLGWKDASHRDADTAGVESVAAARDAAVAILSYRADTVAEDLMAARERTTGAFLESYTDLIEDTVIPTAREKQISAAARVPAAALMSADSAHAVVLVFVDQTVTTDGSPPTGTSSSVRVTLDKVGGRWLVSAFDPI